LIKFADNLAFVAYNLWQIQGGELNPRGMYAHKGKLESILKFSRMVFGVHSIREFYKISSRSPL